MHNLGLSEDILDQIIYRGEGNSSIVIALKAQSKVIRLLKKDGKIMRSSHDHHMRQHPMRSLKFIHLIMKPLTDPFLSGSTELIHLKSQFISRLSELVEAHRPQHRLDKTLLLDDQYALVMDDLCALPDHLIRQLDAKYLCGPTISVEIKPKQGFLPPMHKLVMKSSINDRMVNNVKNCCLYGLTQQLKLSRGRVHRTSSYCPINLFSGCPIKMRNSLEELIHNPQNNFRVFKDLVMAFDESNPVKLSNIFDDFFETDEEGLDNHRTHPIGNEKRFVDLLIQCLLNDHDNKETDPHRDSISTENENSYSHSDSCLQHIPKVKCKRCDTYPSSKKQKSDFTHQTNHKLPQTCVLTSVLKAQRLDTIGAHEANFMLDWLIKNQSNSLKMIDILEELSNPQIPRGFGSLHRLSNESKEQYYFRKVWEFLVSLTAKDCSIITTMRRVAPGCHESIINQRPDLKNYLLKEHRSESYYLFNVGIADLDQKMPLKITRICENLNLIFQTGNKDHVNKESINSQQQAGNKVLVNTS